MTNAENSEITASNPGEDRAARKKQYEALLNASRDMLTLFSGDERLTYLIDEESERFLLRPREKKVLIPLSFFESQPFSENRFLFHLYTVLALYPDFERCPEDYLNRPETFRPEAEELTGVFLDRVRAAGLSGDRAYQPDNVFFYMQNEILSFLEDCDTWASMLCVLQRAPVYQDPAVKADIARMLLLEDVFPAEDDPTGVHRDLAPCLLIREFWGMEEIENPRIRQILAEPVFGTDRFSFLRDQLTLCALRNTPCADRDRMIRSFLLPSFLQLFREDIDRMAFSSTVSLQEQEQKREARRKKSAAQSAENFKEMLRELDSEKKHREAAVGELLHGTRDLSSYGVTDADRALFAHYEAAVRPAREQMKAYWRMLIGDTSREVSVRIPNMPKGRLSVETLIRSWPALTEAERTTGIWPSLTTASCAGRHRFCRGISTSALPSTAPAPCAARSSAPPGRPWPSCSCRWRISPASCRQTHRPCTSPARCAPRSACSGPAPAKPCHFPTADSAGRQTGFSPFPGWTDRWDPPMTAPAWKNSSGR